MSRPLVIAHRGGAALAPENTLPAFARALAAAVDGIELDLQLGADGDLVVTHDLLDPGEAVAGAPRLIEVLDLVARTRPEATIVIDLKSAPWRPGEQDPGRRLIDAAATALDAYPRPDRLVLAAFDWSALEHARRRLPALATAFHTMASRWLEGLSPKQTGLADPRDLLAHLEAWRQSRGPGMEALSPLEMMRDAGAAIWSCQHRDLTAGAVAKARALKLEVWCWTVNTEADLVRVLELGVDAVTTDWPDHVINHLATGRWSA